MVNLTTLERPERSFFWTAPVSDTGEMTTEDPLGLDYVAQQIGLLLLPTLTTRSSRGQAYAMVLYGLELVSRAVERFGHPNTEETKRQLFEKWERMWALATLEFRGGPPPRGDWDTMRGIRGAKAAWKASGERLPLDFPLISRQQELGHLGAYLAPLRRSGLVLEGGLRPTPAAFDIVESFWDEPEDNKHRGRYEEYAFMALEPGRTKLERKWGNLTLAKVGERSRLLSLTSLDRKLQQSRLYAALFEQARDGLTLEAVQVVERAAKAGAWTPRDVLDGAIAGRWGAVSSALRHLLVTARDFGEYGQELVGSFDRIYTAINRGGWIVPKADVASAAFSARHLVALCESARRLLDSPSVDEIRRFPMHGAPCLRLAADLVSATCDEALSLVSAYHGVVQRERRRGAGWIREDGTKLVLNVTSYRARPEVPKFPSFKLDVVRTLLADMGRIPMAASATAGEVGA